MNAQADLNLHWVHMSKGTFSDVGAHFIKIITKTSLLKYTENFTTKKWKFSDKNSDIFL